MSMEIPKQPDLVDDKEKAEKMAYASAVPRAVLSTYKDMPASTERSHEQRAENLEDVAAYEHDLSVDDFEGASDEELHERYENFTKALESAKINLGLSNRRGKGEAIEKDTREVMWWERRIESIRAEQMRRANNK